MVLREVFIQFFRLIVILFSQIIIVNNLRLSTYLNPFFYIFFLMLLPLRTPAPIVLIAGFCCGLIMDMFMNTPGMHTLASTSISYFRLFYFKLTLTREQLTTIQMPDIASTGIRWFLIYAVLFILIHHSVLFFAEAFTFAEALQTFYRIIFSSSVTFVLIMGIHLLFYKVKN